MPCCGSMAKKWRFSLHVLKQLDSVQLRPFENQVIDVANCSLNSVHSERNPLISLCKSSKSVQTVKVIAQRVKTVCQNVDSQASEAVDPLTDLVGWDLRSSDVDQRGRNGRDDCGCNCTIHQIIIGRSNACKPDTIPASRLATVKSS